MKTIRRPNHDAMVRHIKATYRRATAEELDAGRHWYSDARDIVQSLATAHDERPETVAGIIAALSPGVSWERNVDAARELLATGEVRPYTGYGANLAKARRIYLGESPNKVLGGLKVRTFYRLILGGPDDWHVCVDAHAANVAYGVVQGSQLSPRVERYRFYNDVARSYRLVADRLGINPCEAQAVCWLVQKRRVGGVMRS